jgi:hypothetical protein
LDIARLDVSLLLRRGGSFSFVTNGFRGVRTVLIDGLFSALAETGNALDPKEDLAKADLTIDGMERLLYSTQRLYEFA